MALTLEYPENWLEIAATVKQAAGYRCNRCGLKCLPPHNSYRHLDLSLRRKLSAQVHHLDGNPAQNDKSNLVCLCSGCHLRMHRHRPQPTPGQLSLKLKLPKVRKARKQKQNWQLTLADLIDRLPRLSVEIHQQLELDLDNNSKQCASLDDVRTASCLTMLNNSRSTPKNQPPNPSIEIQISLVDEEKQHLKMTGNRTN